MRRWSARIGRIAGIDLYVHATFLLIVGWVAWEAYRARGSWADALGGVVFILCLFGIIVLHELGHALTARRYGIGTKDITLLPIGGVARLERMPDEPLQELWVALAGPAVNVVLAILFFAALQIGLGGGLHDLGEAASVTGGFLEQMFWVNVALVVFNMLPAFPMDGGRVLRALLALRLDRVRATDIAAGIGQAMAFLFGFVGLFWNPFLVLIALFVWLGAGAEAAMVRTRAMMHDVAVRTAMITDFRALDPHDPLSRAVDLVLAGYQQDFPVLREGRLEGLLTRARLMESLAEGGPGLAVGRAAEPVSDSAHPDDALDAVIERLQTGNQPAIPVERDGRLVGLLTTDNLSELLMIREALRGYRSSRSA
ncbi:MAG: site-2 protease family protein [Gemmatimonadota bacterium]|nr:site-2 protease family protein [Gemmatimonadota bacterium]